MATAPSIRPSPVRADVVGKTVTPPRQLKVNGRKVAPPLVLTEWAAALSTSFAVVPLYLTSALSNV